MRRVAMRRCFPVLACLLETPEPARLAHRARLGLTGLSKVTKERQKSAL